MNPFDLHGFAFLGFYVVAGTVTVWGLHALIRLLEASAGSVPHDMTDPYLIAYLRAGQHESLRVATVSLIDRGLLDAADGTLTTRNDQAIGLAQRPIEQVILKRYLKPGKAFEIFKDPAALACCNSYKDVLARKGMVADTHTYMRRMPWVMIAIGLLLAISVIKVNLALSQGRHNIGFLVILTVVFAFIAFLVGRKRRTAFGDRTLKDLRLLFGRLNARAGALKAGGQTNEAALLAAVFGLAALPTMAFPFTKKLYPQSGSGSSCGTSSSSCGSSGCGGGCGGGGCGG